MQTVGQMLKEAREAKLYSLEDIEKHTKIRRELVEALEKDDYEKLPPSTFVQGFIKNYGKFLGLNKEKLLAIYRRDFEAKKHPPIVLDSFANPLKKTRFRLSVSQIVAGVIAVVIAGFFIYLWLEYRQFVGAPPLEVTSPLDQQTIEIPQVLVEGTTDPDANLKVNNQEVEVDENGKFSEEVKLSSESDKVIITATSKFGKSQTIERRVFVK